MRPLHLIESIQARIQNSLKRTLYRSKNWQKVLLLLQQGLFISKRGRDNSPEKKAGSKPAQGRRLSM